MARRYAMVWKRRRRGKKKKGGEEEKRTDRWGGARSPQNIGAVLAAANQHGQQGRRNAWRTVCSRVRRSWLPAIWILRDNACLAVWRGAAGASSSLPLLLPSLRRGAAGRRASVLA